MSEDDEFEQHHRNKTTVFTLEERKLLLKLVNKHYETLNNKKVDSVSTHLKNQAWAAIHKQYLESTGLVKLPRTPQQLKRCWENMKCKARKGDVMSVKLLKYGEELYRLQNRGTKPDGHEKSDIVSQSLNDESDGEIRFDNCTSDNMQVKMEEPQYPGNDHMGNGLSASATDVAISETTENLDCSHCKCDKIERNAKIQLLTLQKQQSDELHQLQLQLARERIKHEKELYKLRIHEMTLKIENERRRAEILDKELGMGSNT